MPSEWLKRFTNEVVDFDRQAEVERICGWLRETLRTTVHRRGVVVAVSGGIDSSVCAALSVKAFGPEKVFALMLPERDSAQDTIDRSQKLVSHLGVKHERQDIAPTLEAIGCYQWRDEAIRKCFPDYGKGWKNKIVIKGGLEGQINHFDLVVESPTGERKQARLMLKEYLQIVAATNYKQRVRKTIEYFHADRLNFAVVGTPNRLEYDQGFFVKNGDGSADVKPIAHLYKSQVYALAGHLRLPEEICSAVPTTDTYSLSQGQDEFYFGLPYAQMDVALWAYDHGVSAAELAQHLKIPPERGPAVYRDIEAKRRAARYLHSSAAVAAPVAQGE
jgi:NAD+ synthase